MTDLEKKLIEWYQEPSIQRKCWAARLFWYPEANNPYAKLKVDGKELEVLFATILNLPSEFKQELNDTQNGRGRFIAMNALRHELPLLTRNPR